MKTTYQVVVRKYLMEDMGLADEWSVPDYMPKGFREFCGCREEGAPNVLWAVYLELPDRLRKEWLRPTENNEWFVVEVTYDSDANECY